MPITQPTAPEDRPDLRPDPTRPRSRAIPRRGPAAAGHPWWLVALPFVAILLLILLATAGCASLPGSSPDRRTPTQPGRVTGQVDSVDQGRRQIVLDADDSRLGVRSGGGDRLVLDYDERTRVSWRGEQYPPEALERGDEIRAEVEARSGGRYYTPFIEVLRSVSTPPVGDVSALEGVVERVDRNPPEVVLDTTAGRRGVRYREDTPVWYRGERFQPANLEPGDRVRVEVDEQGGLLIAESFDVIEAIQDRREPGDGYDDPRSPGVAVTLDGTVEWLDERRGEVGVRTAREGVVTVVLPFNAHETDRRAFADLRRGDRVRVEAEELSNRRYELVRFR